MPIYVYEREDGTTFETIQKMSDDALTTCPTSGQKVVRKMSASTPIFKGSGFYKTDYCSTGSSDSGSASSSSTPKKSCGSGCGCH